MRGKPSVQIVHCPGGANCCHRLGKTGTLGDCIVHVVGGDQRETEIPGEIGKSVVAADIEGVAVIDEFYGDLLMPKEINKPAQGRLGIAVSEPSPHSTFPAAGQDAPVSVSARREVIQVIDRSSFFPATQLSSGDRARESVIALEPSGKDEEMLTSRVRHPVLRPG